MLCNKLIERHCMTQTCSYWSTVQLSHFQSSIKKCDYQPGISMAFTLVRLFYQIEMSVSEILNIGSATAGVTAVKFHTKSGNFHGVYYVNSYIWSTTQKVANFMGVYYVYTYLWSITQKVANSMGVCYVYSYIWSTTQKVAISMGYTMYIAIFEVPHKKWQFPWGILCI